MSCSPIINTLECMLITYEITKRGHSGCIAYTRTRNSWISNICHMEILFMQVCEDNVEKIMLFRRDKLFLAAVNNNLASFRVFFKGISIRPRQSKLEPCCNAAASAVRDTITNGVVKRSRILDYIIR